MTVMPSKSWSRRIYETVGSNQKERKRKNMLIQENENLTLKGRLIHLLFMVKDKETGDRRIRNSKIAERWVLNYYRKKFENKKKNSRTFNLETLIDYLKEFGSEFREGNKFFVIDLNKGFYVDLQIIHPSLIEIPDRKNVKEFGFTIHLPFDLSEEEAKKELEKFKKMEYFGEFKYAANNGIEDYVYDSGEDYKILEQMLRKVLVDLKGYEKEDEIMIEHFFV